MADRAEDESTSAADAARMTWLLTLESGAKLGLRDPENLERRSWVLKHGEGRLVGLDDDASFAWMELLQMERDRFEAELAEGATSQGLPPDDTLAAFAFEAVLERGLRSDQPYFARLALDWMLPSERPQLRDAIGALVKHPAMPKSLRALADRMSR